MHETTQRLYEAAKKIKKVEGQSALARFLNETPQTVKNWEYRGVSKKGMIKAEELLGCSAAWLKTGEESQHDKTVMEHSTDSELTAERLRSRAGGLPLDPSLPLLNKEEARKQWEEAKKQTVSEIHMIGTIKITPLAFKYIAHGSGMTPDDIYEGDVLVIDPGVKNFRDPDILLVEIAGDQSIMKLNRIAGEDWLMFTNPAYSGLRQPLSSAIVLGVVITKLPKDYPNLSKR